MAIMKKLDHPHLVKLYEIIDDPKEKKLYLITELVKKGTLEKKVKQSPTWLTETENDDMRKIFRQLITALEYCHEVVKILHRDIKPENILIAESGDMKLGDFGVSSMLPSDGTDLTTSNAGSAIFFSPEACQGKQYSGRLTDYWACGITLHFMCTGRYPFVSNDYNKLFNLIQFQELELPKHLIGTSLGALMLGILKKKPEERLTLDEIKVHPWLTKNGELGPIEDSRKLEFI
jgi:serine/threonine protein kinase